MQLNVSSINENHRRMTTYICRTGKQLLQTSTYIKNLETCFSDSANKESDWLTWELREASRCHLTAVLCVKWAGITPSASEQNCCTWMLLFITTDLPQGRSRHTDRCWGSPDTRFFLWLSPKLHPNHYAFLRAPCFQAGLYPFLR